MVEKQGKLPDLFRIRPTRSAKRESRVGELFETKKEQVWVYAQLRLLRYWPLTLDTRSEFSIDLDISLIDCAGESFFEMRLKDSCLSHGGNLRVFFWVHDESKTIWIIHGYWKKTQRISEPVKRRVARRIRNLKGQIQDGSMR